MDRFKGKEIGNKIRDIRKESKMSEGDFAKAFGVSAGMVRKWEQGINLPNSKKLDRVLNFKPVKKTDDKPKTNSKSNVKYASKVVRKKYYSEDEVRKKMKGVEKNTLAQTFKAFFSIPILALEDEGFGSVRMNRVADKMVELLEAAYSDSNKLVEYQNKLANKYKVKTIVKNDLTFVKRVNFNKKEKGEMFI